MHIGFLVFPGFNLLDLAGPFAAFDIPRREVKPSPYRLTVFSENGGAVESAGAACGVILFLAAPLFGYATNTATSILRWAWPLVAAPGRLTRSCSPRAAARWKARAACR